MNQIIIKLWIIVFNLIIIGVIDILEKVVFN